MLYETFARVTPAYSGIIEANVSDIWKIVKQWAPSLWIRECGGVAVSFHVLTGETGEQIGATRASVVGDGVVVEQLVAVDADEHYLTWKCISDPNSVNPFPGSFLNYINTLRFTPLTNPSKTLVEWRGDLWTDWDATDTMEQIFANFYQEALQSLEKQIQAEKVAKAPRLDYTQQYPHDAAHEYKDPITLRTLQQSFGESFR